MHSIAPPETPSQRQQRAQEIFRAYCEATGYLVSRSRERIATLGLIVAKEIVITADDLRRVIAVIRKKIARGDSGFTDSSLHWRCLMRDVDTLEERVIACRTAAARTPHRPPPPPISPASPPRLIRATGLTAAARRAMQTPTPA